MEHVLALQKKKADIEAELALIDGPIRAPSLPPNTFRFHVLSLPHTITIPEYSACAFTMKVLKFCKMMTARGHIVYHYGHKDSKVECYEHVPVMFNEDLEKAYGSYDWRKELFKHNTSDHAHIMFNERAVVEVGKRKKQGDFLLPFWGYGHMPVIQAHPDIIAVEPGIGCGNKPSTKQSIFESHSIMNQIYGQFSYQPHWYDAVIPNYFDEADFEFAANPAGYVFEEGGKPTEYFLFVGRLVDVKGLGIAIDMTDRLGIPLLVAGQGRLSDIRNPVPKHVKEIGYIEPKQRCELMKNAKALITATHYAEPFGGVTIEALFCGTPTITTDWGAFAENNLHGITGYRCRTLEQFVWAGRNIGRISRQACRDWAVQNFSLPRVAKMYEEYFKTLSKVHDGSGGFYATNDSRTELDWLVRTYPTPPPLQVHQMSLQEIRKIDWKGVKAATPLFPEDHPATLSFSGVLRSLPTSSECKVNVSESTEDRVEHLKTDTSLESSTLCNTLLPEVVIPSIPI